MNELFDNLLNLIFNYLSIDELIRVRLVCKRWYYLLTNYEIKELIIRDRHDSNYNWYHSCKPINLNNSIFINWNMNIYDYPSFRETFKNVNYLKLRLNSEFNYEYLNEFKKLIHLEVDNNLYYVYRSTDLQLPELKILRIQIQSNDGKLILNSPKLEIISLSRHETVQLKYPESVKQMEVELYQNENLKSFTNLIVYRSNYVSTLNNDLLSKFPDNLEQIHIYRYYFSKNDSEINLIRQLLNERNALKKFKLKIYFKSVIISNSSDRILKNFTKDENELLLFSRYYDLSEDKIRWLTNIDYIKLLDSFNQQLPSTILNKFINIQHIEANQLINNQKQFYLFVLNCKNLISFFLKDTNLNQTFYDDISMNKRPNFVETLSIKEDKLNLDINFIMNFKLLAFLDIDQNASIDLIIDISTKLDYIREIDLKHDSHPIKIKKYSDTFFDLNYDNQNRHLEINEFIKVCNDLRNDQ